MEYGEFNLNASAEVSLADGRKIEVNRWNTSLFTFLGKLATRNHVFITYKEDEHSDIDNGMYVFQDTKGFQELAQFSMQNFFPQHVNLTEVAECDEDAYQKHLVQLEAARQEELERQFQEVHFEVPDVLPDDFE